MASNNLQKTRPKIGYFRTKIMYTNVLSIGLLHLIAVYVYLIYPYRKQFWLILFHFVVGYAGGLGVTAGAHRYYTHRCFKATRIMQIVFLIMYAMAGHNKLHDWVRDHRVHHKYSETDADPHNSKRGFFFSHVGWLMMKKHPEVKRKGKLIDISDIAKDPLVKWYDRNFVAMKLTFCCVLPTALPPLLCGASWYYSVLLFLARYVTLLNVTWLVNSAAHLYGTKPYNKCINPRENLTVSILAIGEGWHNYHHTFPWDYKASEFGKFNVTTFWLRFFERLGLIYDVKEPSERLVRRVMRKFGDGSCEKFGGVEIPRDENLAEKILQKI